MLDAGSMEDGCNGNDGKDRLGLDKGLEVGTGQEYLPADEEIMQDYESMFPEENLLDALMSSSDEEDEMSDAEHGRGPQSPGRSADASAGNQQITMCHNIASPAKQATLQPISRRTRKTKDFEGVQLDELEALLDIDDVEEIENFGKVFDDEEEYQKFLEDLKAVDAHINGEESNNDDSEDEDFIQELKEMLENQVDDCFGEAYNVFSSNTLTSEMPIEKISSLFKKTKGKKDDARGSRRKPKQLRRSLRLNKAEKKLYAAKLATKRSYLALPPYAAAAQYSDMKDLDTLAVVMGVPMGSLKVPAGQVPLPSEFQPGMYQALAHNVRWRPPLPRSVRRIYSHMVASKENIPKGNAPSSKSIGYFSTEQYTILADQIRQHLQMLIQVFYLSSFQGELEATEKTKQMLLNSGNSLDLLRKITGEARYSEWMPCIRSIIDLTENSNLSLCRDVNLETISRIKIAGEIWNGLPYQLLRAMANVRVMFNPQRQPSQNPSFRLSSQMKFTPAEDRLLAWGIRKNTYDWKKIKEEFLPTKSEEELKNRKKNQIGPSKDSIIKDVVTCITMPLTPAEVYLISQALHYYGKQRGKWEVICREHLPYRAPKPLSMLWADHNRASSKIDKENKAMQTTNNF